MFDSFRLSVSPGAALFYPLLLLTAEDWELSALLGGILVHEAGHVLALLCSGGRVRGLTLELSGLRMDAALPPSPRAEALCALAGPAAGLLWSGIAAQIGGERFLFASGLSALLSLFNLLPCLPLDGGRAILALSGRTRLLRTSGLFCSLGLLWAALRLRLYLTLLPALWLLCRQFSPELSKESL